MNLPITKGMLAIDKPTGITSFDVIHQLRRITGIKKIGHTGTLDPFASGMLICLIGSYTRLASIGEAEDKSYLATVKLGSATSSGDPETDVTQTAAVPADIPDPRSIISAALQLHELPVPAHSAIKINGKRAYEYARKNQDVSMPIRFTHISSFEFIPHPSGQLIDAAGELSYRCTVSKGTYIRSLSQWLAAKIGTIGHTVALRRESIGSLDITAAVSLAELTSENWQNHLLPIRTILHGLPAYFATPEQHKMIGNGNPITPDPPLPPSDKPTAIYLSTGDLLALARQSENTLKPFLVIP